MKVFQKISLLVCALVASFSLQAKELPMNLIGLTATATSEIENDLMVVRLTVQHKQDTAKLAADKVNSDMKWALAQVAKTKEIESQTENYNTYPVYRKDQITAWNASQTLKLQTREFENMTALLQVLQEKLNIEGMHFQPTKASRKEASDALIADALDAFKARAQIIQKAMGASGYEIVEMNVDTRDGSHSFPVHYASRSYPKMALESAPAVESGQSTVEVSVSGRIQLK